MPTRLASSSATLTVAGLPPLLLFPPFRISFLFCYSSSHIVQSSIVPTPFVCPCTLLLSPAASTLANAAHPHHLTVHLCCWWLLNGSRYLAVKQLHIACSTGQYWRRSRQWGGSAPNTTTVNAGGSLSLPGPAHPPPLVVSLIPLTHGFCHRCVVHRNTSPL